MIDKEYIYMYYYSVCTVPSQKRAHYGLMSTHPPLWAQFPAKVYCLLEYALMCICP